METMDFRVLLSAGILFNVFFQIPNPTNLIDLKKLKFYLNYLTQPGTPAF